MPRCWSLFLLVVFFLPHCCAAAEDFEIETLRAKLAEQEKILNKLEPKIRPNRYKPLVQNANCSKSIASLNKNNVVNIGGFVKYRHEYYTGKINSIYVNPDDPRIFQARLTMKMNVNKHFDALVHIDLQTLVCSRCRPPARTKSF